MVVCGLPDEEEAGGVRWPDGDGARCGEVRASWGGSPNPADLNPPKLPGNPIPDPKLNWADCGGGVLMEMEDCDTLPLLLALGGGCGVKAELLPLLLLPLSLPPPADARLLLRELLPSAVPPPPVASLALFVSAGVLLSLSPSPLLLSLVVLSLFLLSQSLPFHLNLP